MLLFPGILIIACGGVETAPTAAEDPAATVALALRLPMNTPGPARGEVVVTAKDMVPIRRDLVIEGNRLVVSLKDLPANGIKK